MPTATNAGAARRWGRTCEAWRSRLASGGIETRRPCTTSDPHRCNRHTRAIPGATPRVVIPTVRATRPVRADRSWCRLAVRFRIRSSHRSLSGAQPSGRRLRARSPTRRAPHRASAADGGEKRTELSEFATAKGAADAKCVKRCLASSAPWRQFSEPPRRQDAKTPSARNIKFLAVWRLRRRGGSLLALPGTPPERPSEIVC
jgi:hypothetical protein